jgi:transcriptional regulator with XRE-family HTH domain
MNINNAFGIALKQARKYREMSQEDFSIVSSRTYVSSLERGLKSPTLEKMEMISTCLDVHPLTLVALAYSKTNGGVSCEELINKITVELKELEA